MFEGLGFLQKPKTNGKSLSSTLLYKIDSCPLESLGYNQQTQTLMVLINPRQKLGAFEGIKIWGDRKGVRALYLYHKVPEELVQAITKDAYPGATFIKLIVQGNYSFDKVDFGYDFQGSKYAPMFS